MATSNSVEYPRVEAFKGLNNRIDPIRLGLEWQLQADNVLCDDAGFLVRRPGLALFATGLKDVYGTRDGRLLGIDAADNLVEIDHAGTPRTLFASVTGAPFAWAELGYAVFLMSPTAKWVVYPNRCVVWGSLCPTATATDYPVQDSVSYPPPYGDVLCASRSRIAVAFWEPDRDRSVLYFSRPDLPHEFRLDRDWQVFAGRITLLAAVPQGLIIGTDRAIYIDPYDAPLMRVAEYGALPGGLISDEHDVAYFFTERGLCKAAPFENLTDKALVVTEREAVTAGLLAYQGSRYAIVHQTGLGSGRRPDAAYEPLTISTTHTQGITA